MGYFIDGSGRYYEGDKAHHTHIEVPMRPSPYHSWRNRQWEFNRDNWLTLCVRPERNRLLLNSDWTQLADAPLSAEEKAAWATYRQTLRDLPPAAQYEGFLWPEEPA